MALLNFCLISPQNGGSCGKDAYKLAGFLNVRFSEGGYIGFEILPWYVYRKVLEDIRVPFCIHYRASGSFSGNHSFHNHDNFSYSLCPGLRHDNKVNNIEGKVTKC